MKEIPDISGYFVTEDGDVYHNNKKLLLYKKTDKWNRQRLFFLAKKSQYSVARCVANTYMPIENKNKYIKFYDNNPLNCHKDNIYWASTKEKKRKTKVITEENIPMIWYIVLERIGIKIGNNKL